MTTTTLVRATYAQTAALFAAIHAACDARGDDTANRAALLDECSRLTPPEKADATEHFKDVAKRWQRVTGPREL